jgi:ribosomal protein S17E
MPTYRLRDVFLCIAIEKERDREFFQTMSLVHAVIGAKNVRETIANYINSLFPWQNSIIKQESQSLMDEYIRMFGPPEPEPEIAKDTLRGR